MSAGAPICGPRPRIVRTPAVLLRFVAALLPALLPWPMPEAAAAPPQTAAAACPPPDEPTIKVVPTYHGLRYDHRRGIAWLTNVPGQIHPAGVEGYHHTLGLTESVVTASLKARLTGATRVDGSACVALADAEIRLEWRSTVYIARELPADSCSYKQVLKHEHKHVALDREMRPELSDLLERQVRQEAQRLGMIAAPSTDAATATLKKRLEAVMQATIDAFQNKRNKRQLEIDTRAEYEILPKICGAEVSRFVKG